MLIVVYKIFILVKYYVDLYLLISKILLKSLLGTVHPIGTSVYKVDDRILNLFLFKQKNNVFYLGHSYGFKTKLLMRLKHFGHGINGTGVLCCITQSI